MCTFWTLCSHACEPNLSLKSLETSFMSPGKPWNLVFASPGKSWKTIFTVCTNPVQLCVHFSKIAVIRVVLLEKEMLPVIHSIADSAPAHHARETVALLARKTPRFIGPDLWPPNSPDLNPVDYRFWGCCRNTRTSHHSSDWF